MRKIILTLVCSFVFILYSNSQILYGTTFYGGDNNGGTINKFIPAINELAISKSFENYAANPYYTSLVQATDGKFYGMTFNGGTNNAGIIFTYDPSAAVYLKLKDFDNSNGEGASPTGSFVQAQDGLYMERHPLGAITTLVLFFHFIL